VCSSVRRLKYSLKASFLSTATPRYFPCFQPEDVVKVVVSVKASGVRAAPFPYMTASDLGAFSSIRHLIVPDIRLFIISCNLSRANSGLKLRADCTYRWDMFAY